MNRFNQNILFFIIVFSSIYANAQQYMIGADLSFAKEAEDKKFVFKEQNKPKKVLQIFKDHGS